MNNREIKNGSELADVLRKLPEGERMGFLSAIQARHSAIIKDDSELAKVLDALPQHEWKGFLTDIQAQLPEIIKDGSGLASVLIKLFAREEIESSKLIMASLPQRITDIDDLVDILNNLSIKHWRFFLFGIKAQLPVIIEHGDKLEFLLGELRLNIGDINYGQHILLGTIFRQHLEICKNASDLVSLLSVFYNEIYLILGQERLLALVKDSSDLVKVLKALPEDERMGVLAGVQHLKAQLPEIIKDGSGLASVFSVLPERERLNFASQVNLLPTVIDNEKLNDLLSSLKDNLPDIDNEIKLALRENLLNQLLKSDSWDLLDAAYRHPYFSEHRDVKDIRSAINKISTMFFENRSVIETNSQKILRERRDQLQPPLEKKL